MFQIVQITLCNATFTFLKKIKKERTDGLVTFLGPWEGFHVIIKSVSHRGTPDQTRRPRETKDHGAVLHRLKRRRSSPACPPKLTQVREAAGRAALRPGAAAPDGSKSERPALPWVQVPAGAAALGDPETLAPALRPRTSGTVTLESSPTQECHARPHAPHAGDTRALDTQPGAYLRPAHPDGARSRSQGPAPSFSPAP